MLPCKARRARALPLRRSAPRVSVVREQPLGAVPGVPHRVAGVLPVQARTAARAFPAALQFLLQFRVPDPPAQVAAGVGTVAVGRPVVLVVVVAEVVVGRLVLVGVVTVGRLVGAVGAVRALERVAHRVACLLPGQARAAPGLLPAGAGACLQRGVAALAGTGLLAHVQAVAVGWGVVAVVVEARVVVGAVGVL